MAKARGRVLWRFNDRKKDGRRATWSRHPPKSRVASGTPRAYGNFRDFEDVGGGIEALIPPGTRRATADPELAEHLAAKRLQELQEARRRKVMLGVQEAARLGPFAEHHLKEKARAGEVTNRWLESVQVHLDTAVEFFGEDRELSQLGVREVQNYLAHLRTLPNGRGGTLSSGTCRKYINSLSNLYRRAQAEGRVQPGYNPVAALMEKPTAERKEADWLEVPEATLLLEAARLHEPAEELEPLPFPYELVGTFLLTGGRKSEVLGLTVGDLDFERKTLTFRPHDHRRLKTSTSHRVVPMFPQLEEILRPYVLGTEARIGLLFPSPRTGKMVRDTRCLLDRLAGKVGLEEGRVRTKTLRHTFCAAALQTLDRGQPVSKWTVSRWMGHGGTSLVDRVYGHLGQVRHRSQHVEFRVENHSEEVKDRLQKVRSVS